MLFIAIVVSKTTKLRCSLVYLVNLHLCSNVSEFKWQQIAFLHICSFTLYTWSLVGIKVANRNFVGYWCTFLQVKENDVMNCILDVYKSLAKPFDTKIFLCAKNLKFSFFSYYSKRFSIFKINCYFQSPLESQKLPWNLFSNCYYQIVPKIQPYK